MTRHLLFNTYRSQRGWLWMFWFLCAVQAVLGLMNPTDVPSQVIRTIFFVAECFLGAFAIVGGIQMNPVASNTAFWLTRPISPRQVLTTQFAYVYGLVFAPLVCGLATGWLRAGFTGLQLLGTATEWMLFAGCVITLGAAAAVHTKNAQTFFLLGGGTVGGGDVSGGRVGVPQSHRANFRFPSALVRFILCQFVVVGADTGSDRQSCFLANADAHASTREVLRDRRGGNSCDDAEHDSPSV